MLFRTLMTSVVFCAGLNVASPIAMARTVLPKGVWHSEAYGYVARSSGQHVQTFDVTENTCVRGDRYKQKDFHALYGRIADSTSDSVTLSRFPTKDFLTRLDALPQTCRKPARGKDAALNFDVFAATLSEHYPFFETRGVDWAKATDTARSKLTQETLFETLSSLIAPLNDGHVTLSAGERAFDPDHIIAPGQAPDGAAWQWKSLRVSLRDALQGAESPLDAPAVFAGNRRVLYGRKGDTGYIVIFAEGGWAEGQDEETPASAHAATAAEELDRVLAELGDLRSMIIDLRVNSGGFDAVAMEILSRFTSTPQLAYRKQAGSAPRYDVIIEPSARRRFDGPVAVLISANSVSAGETLALGFASIPQAHLIGQPTRGILSDAIPKTLPNGWTYTLSIERTYLPDDTLVEVRGVVPDTATKADTSWQRDIELAHDALKRANKSG